MNEALQIDLRRYEKDTSAASVNRSLVRTYRLMDDKNQAEEYLQNALRIGLARIKDHPNGANAAYSLGRTYALMEREAEALEQYARAVKLEPTKKNFKEAYLKAKTGRF